MAYNELSDFLKQCFSKERGTGDGTGNRFCFYERFKSEPVSDMAYFVTLLRYIHQNSVKAGMVVDVKGERVSFRHLERLTGISKSIIML